MRVKTDLQNCELNRKLVDTFTVDHLLARLESPTISVRCCLSPIDKGWVPYYVTYLNRSLIDGKDYLCIPFCDGVHFQGYIVDVKERYIIHVDSFTKTADNPTAKKIAEIFFKDESVNFRSLFPSRRQFDSNSCGVWLVSGMISFINGLSEVTDRHSAFEICYNMLESSAPEMQHFDEQPKPISHLDIISEDQVKRFSQASFLIGALKEPENSDYFRKVPPKGIRTTLFYVTDISQTSMSDVLADDNGAYLKSRSNKRYYFCTNGQLHTVHVENGKFYYNVRLTSKSYYKVFVEQENVIVLHRSYGKAKSFPLMRTITTIFNPVNGPQSPFVAVLYQSSGNISEDSKCFPHGNSSKQHERSYLRTSKDVLENTKKKLESGTNPKNVFDQINNESGGVFHSNSQSRELRDMRQVYRQKKNTKCKDTFSPNSANDELLSALNMQRADPDFVRTVSCLRDSYYIFLGSDIQLEDIKQFCCEKENVLCIDTTFNLCENWVSDCCYNNIRLENLNGKNPVFLGPAMIHFNKDKFFFNLFLFHPQIVYSGKTHHFGNRSRY